MNNMFFSFLFVLLTSMAGAQNLEEGQYFIKVMKTGKYLAIEGGSKDNGAKLVQWDYANQANHQFQIKKNRDGVTYSITALHSNKNLYVEGAKERDGTKIIQWEQVDADHGKWYLLKNDLGDGWYIMNKKAEKRIRLRDGDYRTNNGMPLVISNESPEQLFLFEKIPAATPKSPAKPSLKIQQSSLTIFDECAF